MSQSYDERSRDYRQVFSAAERDVDELIDVVADKRIPLTITNGAGQNLAHIAAKYDNVAVLKYVLSKEPRLLYKDDRYRCSVLHLAVVRGAINSVKYLVQEHGADPCYLGGQYKDRSAVHVAVEFNRLEILKYFVENRRVNFNTPNAKQKTPPIFLAVKNRNWDVIEYLVGEKDANVQLLNSNEETILFPIVRENFMGFFKYLLEERRVDFDVDWKSRYGVTVVHVAAGHGRIEILEYLVDKKYAYVNAQKETDQRTPLHYAAANNNYEVCKFLIERGANPCLTDKYGHTPADKAEDGRLVDYLEEAIRNRQPRGAHSRNSLRQPASFESRTSRENIPRISRSVNYNIDVESLSPSNSNLTCFQNFLFLATSMTRIVRKGRDLKTAELFPSPAAIVRSRMSSVAIDAVDAHVDY